jgi:calcineurin-like phosphoesterase family protein
MSRIAVLDVISSVKSTGHEIWEKTINDQHIVVCHYAMRTWGRSHFNSWQLYGHSHGTLEGHGKQMDIGVDTNHFYPYSFDEIKRIMNKKEDNLNYLKLKEKRK